LTHAIVEPTISYVRKVACGINDFLQNLNQERLVVFILFFNYYLVLTFYNYVSRPTFQPTHEIQWAIVFPTYTNFQQNTLVVWKVYKVFIMSSSLSSMMFKQHIWSKFTLISICFSMELTQTITWVYKDSLTLTIPTKYQNLTCIRVEKMENDDWPQLIH